MKKQYRLLYQVHKLVFVNSGKNRIRDLLSDDFDYGLLGTDNTVAAASQTALLAEESTTEISVSTTKTDKQITVDYNIPSTTGNGNNYTEFGTFNSSDVMFSRNVFASLTKTSTEQWQITTVYKIL